MIATEDAVSDSSQEEGPHPTLGGHRTPAAGSVRRGGGSSWARAFVVVCTGTGEAR